MYTPHSLEIALLMMITSAICWGSWANTYKGVKNYRFELFYWDYAVGIFLISLIFAFTLGSTSNDANSFLNNVHSADTSNIVSVMIGWLVLTLTNGPRNLQTVMIITVFSGIVMMVITFWWKISMHASSLGGVATMLTVLYGAVMLPLFVLLVLVSWSRVVLRRHTVTQVIAGSLAGIVLSLVILKLRGVN